MSDDAPVIPPPASLTVEDRERKVVLYTPDGTPLVKPRHPAGFDTSSRSERK